VHDVTSEAGVRGPGSGPRWVKSSFSYANGDCVQVARLPDGQIGVRHSKDPCGPVLRFTLSEWAAFISGVQDGEFVDVLAG
jgi:Domain of unknown function (DUF397)